MADRSSISRQAKGLISPLSEPPAPEPGAFPRPRPGRRTVQSTGWLVSMDLVVLIVALAWAVATTGQSVSLQAVRSFDPRTWPLALALVPLSLGAAGAMGLYRPGILRSRRRELAAGARALIWSAALSVGGVFLLVEAIPVGLRGLILAYHAAFAVWVLGVRPVLANAVRTRAWRGEGRVLILGSGPLARQIARGLATRAREETELVSFIDDRQPDVRHLAPFRMAGIAEVAEIADELSVDLVVVARKDLPREEIIRLSDALLLRGIRVKVLSNVLDRLFESVPSETFHGLHLLQMGETPLRGGGLRWKRVVDLVGSLAGGILILPLLGLVAAAIRLSSPGPVFYRQTRIGRGGNPFCMFKFRSMVLHDDDGDHQRYLEEFLRNGTPASVDMRGNKIYKRVDDPRVTPIGRILRRTSLDELPQLWNVIRGEMSLVGPRPCLPFEYDLYEDWQRRRLDVTPGMTGLWQVTGRSYVTFDDMVLLDLFYIGNWSMGLDARLLLRTVPVILFGKGGL